MSGKASDGGVLGDDDDDDQDVGDVKAEIGDGVTHVGREEDEEDAKDGGGDDKEYFRVPNLGGARHFKGITKNRKTGEVEVTIRLPSR